MADEGMVALRDALGKIMQSEHADLLRESVALVVREVMDLEASVLAGAERYERTDQRAAYRNGYRPREWDTRVGTIGLAIPKLRQGSYLPSFLHARKRSEQALLGVVMEAYTNGVSTRKVERLVCQLGVESMSKSQVSRICQALDERVEPSETAHWRAPTPIFGWTPASSRCATRRREWSARRRCWRVASLAVQHRQPGRRVGAACGVLAQSAWVGGGIGWPVWERGSWRVSDGVPTAVTRLSAARATVATVYTVLIGVAGGLAAAWVGVALAYRWDVRRRTVAVVARAEIIVRRDLQPPVLFGPSNNERAQLVLDRADDHVRACEDELRALATERRWYRGDLRALAEALDTTWQAYALLVWYFTLPPNHPMRGHEPDALGYVEKHAALGRQVAELRGRLESRLP